jgi:hypothetical protein
MWKWLLLQDGHKASIDKFYDQSASLAIMSGLEMEDIEVVGEEDVDISSLEGD